MKKLSRPSSPQRTLRHLIQLFPNFEAEWAKYGKKSHDYTFHSVLSTFSQFFGPEQVSSEKQLAEFGRWLDQATVVQDNLENAVATCFLEHIHQIGVEKLLRRHIAAAKRGRLPNPR